ncbi:MAG: hypothetical protein FD163_2529 [Hyphomonadaceae bacterium]|nr:MAG: hypothetical protein FD128_2025 [Hyphomonadaceae bacterium]KAF0182664.1 MAG: hypothetical protein FD163_2529 [Hyphomonadaceae bacterium]
MTTAANIQNVIQAIGNQSKAVRTLINGNLADLAGLSTTAKNNLVAAINELKAAIDALGSAAIINDAATNSVNTWSSTKIDTQITAALAALTSGAPGALDTLDELALALGDDANFAATITTALSNRVRFDAAQALTAPQKVQANTNIGAVSLTDFGAIDTDYVAIFNAALV